MFEDVFQDVVIRHNRPPLLPNRFKELLVKANRYNKSTSSKNRFQGCKNMGKDQSKQNNKRCVRSIQSSQNQSQQQYKEQQKHSSINLRGKNIDAKTQLNCQQPFNSSEKEIMSCKQLQKKQFKMLKKIQIKLNLNPLRKYREPQITAKSFIVYDITNNRSIYSKKPTRRRQIASLTKIMTCYIAIKQVQRLGLSFYDLKIKISKQASIINGTTAFLKQGMLLRFQDLLYGMMLPSGNDAAYAIAQTIGIFILNQKQKNLKNIYDVQEVYKAILKKNGVPFFLQKMNQFAKSSCLINTFFTNPHGLSQKTNISTAQDVSKLVSIAMENQKFRKVVLTRYYQSKYRLCYTEYDENLNKKIIYREFKLKWENTNKLLWQGWDGVKTGITPNAGPCLAASFKGKKYGNSFHYCIVVLNCESMQIRWQQCKNLLNFSIEKRL